MNVMDKLKVRISVNHIPETPIQWEQIWFQIYAGNNRIFQEVI